MKFEDCHFMSIGTRCTNLFLLGRDREFKGPVDNILCSSPRYFERLLNNSFLDSFKDIKIINKNNKKIYQVDDLIIEHNNPQTEEFKVELINRINNFNTFLAKVKTDPTYYFLFCFNEYFLDKKVRKLLPNFTIIFNLLKDNNLLNKTIFIGTIHTKDIPGTHSFWDFWCKEFNIYIKKYNLKYIEIENLQLSFCEYNKKEFIKKLATI